MKKEQLRDLENACIKFSEIQRDEKEQCYNESKTDERMNVIGQNGNDGEHYENETPEEETLSKIKLVLYFNNDAQAIRLLEQYGQWQQERMYSEEDMRTSFGVGMKFIIDNKLSFEEWFKQFKKTR